MSEKLLIEIDANITDGSDKIGKLRAEIDNLTESTRKLSKEVQKSKDGDTEKAKQLGAEMTLLKEKKALLNDITNAEKIALVESKKAAAEKTAIFEQARKEAKAELAQFNQNVKDKAIAIEKEIEFARTLAKEELKIFNQNVKDKAIAQQKALTERIELARTEAKIELGKFNEDAKNKAIDPTSIIAQRKELNLLTQQYYALSKAELENANIGGILKGRINELYASVSKAEQGVGNFKRAVGQYNTAGMAMSQVLREIPAFTFSAQTGFLALSNNLPILGDEMKKIANSIDGLTQKKRGWGAAFMEMGKSVLSFGGAMTILIGLLPMIIPYIQELFTGVKKLNEEQKKLGETLKENEKSVFNNANAYKVFKGEITESQAKFMDLAFEMNKGLTEIETATQSKIESINGFWNTLWTNIVGGFGFVKGETIRYIDEVKARMQGEIAEQALIQKYINNANSGAIGIANEYRNKLRMLHIESIKDEVTREKARINELRRIEKEKVQVEFTTKEIYANTIAEIDKLFDAQIANVKAKTTKTNKEKIQAEKDYQKELLALIEQYHDQLAENQVDEQRKAILLEKEKHHRVIDELKSHLIVKENLSKEELEINKQVNKNIEEEEKRHKKAMEEIAPSFVAYKKNKTDYTPDVTEDEERRKEKADKLLEGKKKYKELDDADDEKKRKAIFNASIDAAQSTVDAVSKIKQDAIDRDLKRELKAIQRQADGENVILENKLRNGLITEGQYNDEKLALDRKTQEQEDKANREAFEKKKKIDIAQAAMDGALAIIKTYAQYGFTPVGWIAAGGQAIATGTQIAVIKKQEYALGGKIKGKSHAQGGIDINVEGDEGIVNKNSMRSNQVMSVTGTPSQITSAVNASGGGVSWESGATLAPAQRSSNSTYGITASQMQMMLADLGNRINDKEVYITESKITKAQKNVKTYEKSSRF